MASLACPVCMDPFSAVLSDGVHDNALCCARGHNVCTRCAAVLARPTARCGPDCSGLNFACPLCRGVSCVSNLQMLVLVKGSWSAAVGAFPCVHECQAWNRGEEADDTSSTASTETTDGEEEAA